MSTLFISHSSRDNEPAAQLKARLEAQGFASLFLDFDPEKGIQAGVSWERTLYTKLRACRAVVALCSDHCLSSQWCFAEIALVRMEGKELFALQIDPWRGQTRMPSILTEGQNIDLRTHPEAGDQRLWNGFEAKGIVPEEHRSWTSGESPYPGLKAFDESDAPIFFGREVEVREGIELLNRVRRQGHPRMVLVLGASGSGKSSIARAGLLPRLRHDTDDHPPFVLAVMRSDYLGVLQKSVPPDGLGFRSLSVGPMSREGMRQVIVQPAQLGQLQLEDGLTEALSNDTGDADVLPLLAFTLRVMWERYRDDQLLEMREYLELGRLQGAVARVADETMQNALDKGSESRLRDAFLSLARPTEEGRGWARHPMRWSELGDDVQPMLQDFIDNRLLVKREDDTIEVAHEALFWSWATLRSWLNTNTEALHLLREVQLDAVKWQQAESLEDKEAYLWRGGRLARAHELRHSGVLSLRELDRAFIENALQAENAKIEAEAIRQRRELRRARQIAMGATVAGLLMAALFVWALALKYHAERVQRGQTKALKDYAQELQDQQPLEALVEGLRAAKLATEQSSVDPDLRHKIKRVLRQSLRQIREKNRFAGHHGQVNQISIRPDGKMIATASRDGTGKLWNLQGEVLTTLEGHQQSVNDILFHPDRRLLAAAGGDRTVKLWGLDGQAQQTLIGHRDAVWGVDIHLQGPNRREMILATASHDHTARLWQLTLPEVHTSLAAKHVPTTTDTDVETEIAITDADLRDDMIAIVSSVLNLDDDRARLSTAISLWTLQGTFSRTLKADPNLFFEHALFQPQGRYLATLRYSKDEHWIELWDLKGQPKKRFKIEQPITAFAFSPDGQTLAYADWDLRIKLLNLDTGADLPPSAFSGHLHEIYDIQFSPDGQTIASASDDNTVRVWNRLGEERQTLHHPRVVKAVSLSPDGQTIATGGR